MTEGELHNRLEQLKYHTYTGGNSKVIEVSNVLKVLEEAKAAFPSMFKEGKYSSDYERAKANQKWFEKWLGEEK